MLFEDRTEAGRRLAIELERWRSERPVVIGLPRGGVPVAAEVASALGAPLDVLVVRKLGAPGMPEYGMGAIAEGGVVHLSRDAMASMGLTDLDLGPVAEREARELERRVRIFRGERPIENLRGRTVIVVDDGIATGGTAMAAVKAVRELGADKVILAAPVVAPSTVESLRSEADEVVFVEAPEGFYAVGAWYRHFPQTSDEEVVECLARIRGANQDKGGAEGGSAGGTVGDPDGDLDGLDQDEGQVAIPVGQAEIAGTLAVPARARGVVIFAHGAGSSRRSLRNRYVARLLRDQGFATLLVDMNGGETGEGAASRLVAAARWLGRRADTGHLKIGLLGSSAGAAAALRAVAMAPGLFAAVVTRSGRPDLAGDWVLSRVKAPVLMVVGGLDEEVRRVNEAAREWLAGRKLLVEVPGASHLFEEPGALDAVARLAGQWLGEYLQDACGPGRSA